MSYLSNSVLYSGNNIIPNGSGVSNIGSPSIPISVSYANEHVSLLPSCAWIYASGNPSLTIGASSNFTIASGNVFQAYSGANFTITASNPHRITYTGSGMLASINMDCSYFINANSEGRVAIIKNGSTAFTGTNIYTLSRSATGDVAGGCNWILPIVSGDYFQVGIWANGSSSQNSNGTLQMSIVRV